MPEAGASPRSPMTVESAGTLRSLLLAVVALGAVGLLVELALLEHWEARAQLVPLLVLLLVLGSSGALALAPADPARVRLFRWVMAVAVVAGAVGVGLHLSDNLAFEREILPDAPLGAALWEAFHGATPLLAPGSLIQLGLVGLVLTWRHPALRRDTPSAVAGDPLVPQENP